MTREQKKKMLPIVLWINLLIGFWNLYLYTNNAELFNLIVGSLNIGVWVFNRHIAYKIGKYE